MTVDENARTAELSSHVSDTPKDTLTYTWDFGDGAREEGVDLWRVRHTWAKEGTYTVTLRVRDEDGGETTSTADVTVGERPRTPLVPPGDTAAATLAVTSFSGTTSGGIAALLEGRVKPIAGIYLNSVAPGVCQFSFSAWDPAQLAHVTFITRLRNLRPGGARYRLTDLQMYLGFQDTLGRYRAQESILQVNTMAGALAGLRGLVSGAGGTPVEVSEGIGVDPTRMPEQRAERIAPPARSPFGLSDAVSFRYVSGTVDLVIHTHDRAEATFDVLLENTDKRAKAGPPTLVFRGTSTLNLQTARGEGLVSYQDCAPSSFAITRTSPEEGTEHQRPSISPRVVFDEPYDPATLHDATFEVGYRNTGQEFVPVKGRIVRSEREARLVPDEPLLGGVRYEARVKTGRDGVRGKNGQELADPTGLGHHAWSFVTRIVFRNEAGRQDNHLGCHVLQTVRDAPLIKAKPAVARIYASWVPHPGVFAGDQVESFGARLTLKDVNGRALASAVQEFVRPDLWKARGVSQAKAEHTANLFGWTPDGTEGSQPRIEIQAETTPRTWEDVYYSRCPATYWMPEPRLRIDYYLLNMGEWFPWPPDTTFSTLHAIYSQGEQYALQLFPFQSIRGRYRGMMTVGPRLQLELLEREQISAVRAALHERGALNEKAALSASADLKLFARGVASDLVTAYATMAASATDLVLAFGPRTHLSGGSTVVSLLDGAPGAVYSLFDDDPGLRDHYIHAWVHEVGHYLLLDHLPYINTVADQELMKKMRESTVFQYDGIEGFRILRGGWAGWNKSSTEGNGEGPRLAPLMFPATVPYRNAFIATHHYHQIQRDIEKVGLFRSGANRRPEPVLIASASPTVPWVAPQNEAERPRRVGLAGVIAADDETVWLGPLVGGTHAPSDRTSGREFALALLDGAGATLSSAPFDVRPSTDDPGYAVFVASVPWSEGAAAVVVRRGDTIMARRGRSAHSPIVTLTSPTPGQRVDGDTTLSWSASDADDDALTTTVLYSNNGGADGWSTLAMWLEGSSFTVRTSMLEPGSNPTFRVVVSDGFDEAVAEVSVAIQGRLDVVAALPSGDLPAARDPEILLLLNSELAAGSAADARVTLRSGTGRNETVIEGVLTYDAERRTLTIRPGSPLVAGTRYQATLTGTLVNRFGDRLTTPYTWSFTVARE